MLARFSTGCLLLAAASCAKPAHLPKGAASRGWINCVDQDRIGRNGSVARVQICADENARWINGNSAGPGGARVARMWNSGPGIEVRWGLQVDKEYIVTVTPGGPNGQFIIAGPSDGNYPLRQGAYWICEPRKPRPAESEAKFGTCQDNGHFVAADGTGPHKHRLGSGDDEAANPADGPAWISCPDGCCTTEAQ